MAGLVAAVAVLLLAVNLAVPAVERRINRSLWLVEKKWQLIDHAAPPVDILVLGDSSGNQAVIPSELRARLGMSALNLCTFGFMTVAGDAWMLYEYIRLNGTPRVVVLVHVHDIWDRTPDPISASYIPRPWSFWTHAQPPLGSSVRVKISLATGRYLPLYTHTWAMARLIQHPLDALQTEFHLDPEGFMPATWQSDLENQKRVYLAAVRKSPFRLSPANRAALARILTLSDQHGFEVLLASAPTYRPIVEDESFRAFIAQRNDTLTGIVAQARHARLVLADPPPFEAALLEGVDHPNVEGAKTYTAQLADELVAARRVRVEAPRP